MFNYYIVCSVDLMNGNIFNIAFSNYSSATKINTSEKLDKTREHLIELMREKQYDVKGLVITFIVNYENL